MRISIVIDCQDPDRLRPFWEAALDYKLAATLEGYRVLAPAQKGAEDVELPVLILQQVPEPRTGKNRLHLDLHPEDSTVLLGTLVDLGATLVGERVFLDDISWQVLADPEGNEFCVVDHGAAVRPR